jgi:hypothetical protein
MDRHGGVGLEDPEVEALFDVETNDVDIVIRVADGQVLSGLEDEVATPQAEDDPAVETGRPHQRAPEDFLQVVEQQVTIRV